MSSEIMFTKELCEWEVRSHQHSINFITNSVILMIDEEFHGVLVT